MLAEALPDQFSKPLVAWLLDGVNHIREEPGEGLLCFRSRGASVPLHPSPLLYNSVIVTLPIEFNTCDE